MSLSATLPFIWVNLTSRAESTSAQSLQGGLSWDTQVLGVFGTQERLIIEMSELAVAYKWWLLNDSKPHNVISTAWSQG